MTILSIDELTMIAFYVDHDQAHTLSNMEDVPVEEMDSETRQTFEGALDKLRNMNEAEFQELDFRDALLADDSEAALWP